MALVFRTDQSTPLTNDQVDNNFKYLRDQILLKYSITDFTAANISLKLRTTAVGQTSLQLAQANAINAWLLRDMQPLSGLPNTSDKSSIVSRNSNGNITVATVTGNLTGKADEATLADQATKLATARNINGVSFDGTANITVVDATKLPLAGGTLVGKLNLSQSQAPHASINFGSSSIAPDAQNKVNGDMWATTSGLFYHIQGQTDQVAPLLSPTFTGTARAPGYTGLPDQIITLSHLDHAVDTINSALALKAPLASPTFTGTVTVPTPIASSNTTTAASTQYVTSAISTKASDITSAYQTYTTNAIVTYSNTVNTLLALKAGFDSPIFTGVPQAPTASVGTNNTQIATTAFTTGAINTIQNTLNSAVAALQDAINATRPVPVGAVFYMAISNVPYGYLEANGQAVSNTTYSALWVALGSPLTTPGDAAGTFRLPDLRGEFVRGWDHGRGIDTNRDLRSVQYSQNIEHNHGMPGDDQLSFANGYGGWTSSSRGSFPYDARSSYGGGGTIWNTTTEGGGESRPRNVALMPIIKW